MRRLTFACLAGIGTSLAAPAQSIASFQGVKHTTGWTASASAPGPFGRADSGSFTPGPYRDLVQLDGSQPVLLVDPDLGFAPAVVPVTATDVATLAGGHPSGLDAIAVVSAAGLELWWWDAVLGGFGYQSLNSTTWSGALMVRTADLDANGSQDLYGVAADGVTFLSLLAGPTGGYVAGPSFVAPAPVVALEAVHWDGDSDREIGLMTDLGVEVRDLDGALLDTFAAVLPGGALCTLGQDGQAQERLLWITNFTPTQGQLLMVLSPLGVSDAVDLGALKAVAAVATDYDGDGDDDVLISHKRSYSLLRIENQRSPSNPNGPSFLDDPSAMETFFADAPGTALQNNAWPVTADLDGDGDEDVAFAGEKLQNFLVFRGEAVAEDELRVGVTALDYVVTSPASHGHLNLSLAQPVSVDPSATHLDVVVRRQASPTSAVEPLAVGHQVLALPTSWPASLAVQIPEGDCAFASAYHVEIRVVEQNAGGEVLAAYPTELTTFSLVAADRGAYEADETVGTSSDVPAPTPEDSTYDSGTMRRKRVQSYPTGAVPTVPTN